MDNCIFQRGEFVILKVGNEYIVVNRNKIFKEGHTHIKCFDTAEYVINMARYRRIPRHLSPYLLTSLVRITNDEAYAEKIRELISVKAAKRQRYANR